MTRWLSSQNIWTQLKNVIRMIPLLARVLCPHITPSFMAPELVTWDSPRHYILRSGNPIKTGDQIPNLYIDIHIWYETYPSPQKKKTHSPEIVHGSLIHFWWWKMAAHMSLTYQPRLRVTGLTSMFTVFHDIFTHIKKRVLTEECDGIGMMSIFACVMVKKHRWKGGDNLGDCWKVSSAISGP